MRDIYHWCFFGVKIATLKLNSKSLTELLRVKKSYGATTAKNSCKKEEGKCCS